MAKVGGEGAEGPAEAEAEDEGEKVLLPPPRPYVPRLPFALPPPLPAPFLPLPLPPPLVLPPLQTFDKCPVLPQLLHSASLNRQSALTWPCLPQQRQALSVGIETAPSASAPHRWRTWSGGRSQPSQPDLSSSAGSSIASAALMQPGSRCSLLRWLRPPSPHPTRNLLEAVASSNSNLSICLRTTCRRASCT